jgi:translation initiation factor IF-3
LGRLIFCPAKGIHISTSDYRLNEQIRAREVRVIGAKNENLGVITIQEALRAAREAGKDLVEVSPNADPPVCRILDYGKFLYEKTKKEKEARKAQKVIEVKEIQLRPKTADHHAGFKVRDARRWLEEGKKVKVRIKFRGREITYPQIARQDLMDIAKELEDVAIVEQMPDLEGRTMLMVLAPNPKRATAKPADKPASEKPAAKGGGGDKKSGDKPADKVKAPMAKPAAEPAKAEPSAPAS